MTDAKLTGVVLAGGESRRMGQNKALLAVGGEKAIEAIIGAMSEVSLDVTVAANGQNASAYHMLGREIVCDRYPGQGPLSGIHAALHAARTPWIIVAACDMPFVTPGLFRFLKKIAEDAETGPAAKRIPSGHPDGGRPGAAVAGGLSRQRAARAGGFARNLTAADDRMAGASSGPVYPRRRFGQGDGA